METYAAHVSKEEPVLGVFMRKERSYRMLTLGISARAN